MGHGAHAGSTVMKEMMKEGGRRAYHEERSSNQHPEVRRSWRSKKEKWTEVARARKNERRRTCWKSTTAASTTPVVSRVVSLSVNLSQACSTGPVALVVGRRRRRSMRPTYSRPSGWAQFPVYSMASLVLVFLKFAGQWHQHNLLLADASRFWRRGRRACASRLGSRDESLHESAPKAAGVEDLGCDAAFLPAHVLKRVALSGNSDQLFDGGNETTRRSIASARIPQLPVDARKRASVVPQASRVLVKQKYAHVGVGALVVSPERIQRIVKAVHVWCLRRDDRDGIHVVFI
mmetsp:Transcript_4850/g.15195  ORF Transcript_4850/g.15195 Transcript_4850/m.15195 type:complete len:291 (+) Transcript_4850:643-1515(+)